MPQREPIDPGKYYFSTLMNDIENGRVRLPPFQREFVWTPVKVVDLVDSLFKGYPIGSFFYWKANRNGVGKVESLANIINRGLVPAQVAGGVVVDGKAK